MSEQICSLCGEPLDCFTLTVIRTLTQVTCCNKNCPLEGRTLSVWQHAQECERLRHDIVVQWGFDRCLSKPVPATLTTALVLLFESAVAGSGFEALRDNYCRFVTVCALPDLLYQAEYLMQSSASACGGAK